MKLNLDDLERKARAATQEGVWEIRVPDRGAGIEGVIVQTEDGRQIAEAYDSTPWTDTECIANGEHIAAASPPVVLALIARIRRLEEELARAAGVARARGANDYADDFMRVAQDREDFDAEVSRR